MGSTNRDQMQRPDFLSDADWEMLKQQTASLERIRGDAKADVIAAAAKKSREPQ